MCHLSMVHLCNHGGTQHPVALFLVEMLDLNFQTLQLSRIDPRIFEENLSAKRSTGWQQTLYKH